MSLSDELPIGDVDHDELVTVLAASFPHGEWHGGNTTVYRTETSEAAVTVRFKQNRIAGIDAGPGLSDELLQKLKDDVAALAAPHRHIVWRDVLFNVLPMEGFWRFRDEWQIVSAPPQAPRPRVAIADHPFIVELRVGWYPNTLALNTMIRQRRAWEVSLILNLVLRGHVTRFGVRGREQVWAQVGEGETYATTWVAPGYFIPNWVIQTDDFSPTDDLRPLPEVSDDVYRTRRGIGEDDVFEIPAVLSPLLEACRAVGPEVRERFLRACYWLERSRAAWDMSVSLGHIAAVNAIETILPTGSADICPCCRMNRAPGVTRRFHDFVETYAPLVPKSERKGVYKLRSSLVHQGHVFDIDRPGPWGALISSDFEQRDV